MWRSTFVSETIFNYVAINKDLEKFPPQLYKIEMKICCDQGYNDIGVFIAKKWRHQLFYLQSYFSVLGALLLESFTRAFPSNFPLDNSEV